MMNLTLKSLNLWAGDDTKKNVLLMRRYDINRQTDALI